MSSRQPIPIVATILMLLSPRARSTDRVFIGWIIAIVVLLWRSARCPTCCRNRIRRLEPVAAALKIAIGAALVVLGIRKWIRRPGTRHGRAAWMARVDTMSGRGAMVFGMLLGANPKNLLLALAAGVTIGSSGVTIAEEAVAVAVFTAVAAASVAIPVSIYLAAANRMQAPLVTVRQWLVANNATVMSVQSLIIGVVVIGAGIGNLG